MALAIAKNMFANAGLTGYEFMSAGVAAADGQPASRGAIDAAAQVGLDLVSHLSCELTGDIARESTVILTMTKAHKDAVCVRFPEVSSKVCMISEYAGHSGDVLDPFGQDLRVYCGCRDSLAGYIKIIAETLATTQNFNTEVTHENDRDNCDSQ